MLQGTKRLFPTDYGKFVEAMIEAAEEDALPVMLQLEDIKDFTLKDLQDLFYEFNNDTGLYIDGHIFLCEDCGAMHLVLEIDYPEESDTPLQ